MSFDTADPRHLLRLPSRIRDRIYTYAGVANGMIICLDGPIQEAPFQPPDRYAYPPTSPNQDVGRKSPDYATVRSLMLTSRSVYDEVSATLYASNTFILQDHTTLRRLRPSSLRRLTQLRIVLHRVLKLLPNYSRNHYPLREAPLDLSSRPAKDLLGAWKETVTRIRNHIQPDRLNLALVCEISDWETPMPVGGLDSADVLLESLQLLPALASIHLRLGAWRNDVLSEKAFQLATQLQDRGKPPAAPFRFMDLPTELRLRILRHTHLVTPKGRVTWSLRHRFDTENFIPGDPQYQSLKCRQVLDGIGFFCPIRHASYTPDCSCPRSPTALFLVCRTMTAEARDVFFRSNYIEVRKSWDVFKTSPSGPAQYAALDFFADAGGRGMMPETLRFLKKLSIMSFHVMLAEDKAQASDNWRRAVRRLRQDGGLDLQSLEIQAYREEVPEYDVLCQQDPAQVLATIRGIIHEAMWPLDEGRERRRPMGTRKMCIEFTLPMTQMCYVARQQDDDERLPASHEYRSWGSPFASLVTSADSAESEIHQGESGEWVEEVFMRKKRPATEWVGA